jgi:predicted kinase
MLYIFGGLPGVGKSTLSRLLSRRRKAVYVRVDTIEQAIRAAGGQLTGPEGYVGAYGIAADNLVLGLPVVADCVNPLEETRMAWRDVATRCGVSFSEVEVICSDMTEHRTRVETRVAEIEGFRLPSWNGVLRRTYEPWTTPHVLIDTAGQTPEESICALERALTGQPGDERR